jgi:EAL domain
LPLADPPVAAELVGIQPSEARRLAPGAWLSLNVSPVLLAEGNSLGRILADGSRPIVLEVTEHEVVEAYAPLREAMLALGPGVRLAVDDAGAGVANFSHLVELAPEMESEPSGSPMYSELATALAPGRPCGHGVAATGQRTNGQLSFELKSPGTVVLDACGRVA